MKLLRSGLWLLLWMAGLAALHSRGLRAQAPEAGWPTYGGDAGGQRYSAAGQITKANVKALTRAWVFHTGAPALERNKDRSGSFEATPVLFKGTLYLTSPYDEVYAVDPETGAQRWTYDPLLDWKRQSDIITSRGVATWSGVKDSGPCADRIFVGTLDARLMALDAQTGKPCQDFGQAGTVDLSQNVDYRKGDNYAITSPPTVLGDVVVVGAGIKDNLRVDVERGDVRGFDARTGRQLWTWEPIPWANRQKVRTGAANTWAPIAADVEHGLVYLPTSSPSPDYYGGLRLGDDRDADSLVALDAKTGRKVWSFQTVHHNLWDYDVAAEPMLFTFRGGVPAVAIATKTAMVFVFNRLTGAPLYPIDERPMPKSDVPGEVAWPTQPISSLPPLTPLTLDMTQQLGGTAVDDASCRKLMAGMRYEGIFTPPSLRGTIVFPSNVGGVNWGGTAFDPRTGMLYANTNRMPFKVTLIKRPWIKPGHAGPYVVFGFLLLAALFFWVAWKMKGRTGLKVAAAVVVVLGVALALSAGKLRRMGQTSTLFSGGGLFVQHFGKEYGKNEGAPFALLREPVETADHHPCSPMPWGTVSSLNLNTGQAGWQTPLGTMIAGQTTGTTNVGGPMVTAGGLVFSAASKQRYLFAFDSATGTLLWKAELPATAQATPMSYIWRGRQYVLISAGGHDGFPGGVSDSLIAFALPQASKE